jgi:hypothetical protein
MIGLVGIALLLAILLQLRILPRPNNQKPGNFSLQLVYLGSADDLVQLTDFLDRALSREQKLS